MKLSISHIGWEAEHDVKLYEYISKAGYNGLEIAPTRIINESPYDHITAAKKFSEDLYKDYRLQVSSIQSIWYGRKEKLFNSLDERQLLTQYTKKAIRFAAEIGAKNLVFGCPQNRCIRSEADRIVAEKFLKELGDYALKYDTVLALEANPVIYNTNFMNTTDQAIKMIEMVDSKGVKLNLDIGTMLYNHEEIKQLKGYVKYINHVHISEPYLKLIRPRKMHEELKKLLLDENYDGYISIEMKKTDSLADLFKVIDYVQAVFL